MLNRPPSIVLEHAEQAGVGEEARDRNATKVPATLQKSLAFGRHESQAESKNRKVRERLALCQP